MKKIIQIKFFLFLIFILGCDNITSLDNAEKSTSQVAEENDTLTAAVRGVWLTNVASDVLSSRENIEEAMILLDSLGFNTVFVVTWNKAATTYRSQVMDSIFNQPIDPRYDDRDPLQEVIEEAHARDIKVFAWFEFGFASAYNENGGMILEKFPEWAARDKEGNIASKNNFEWMNALHPEVQNFLTSLVLEVVKNYDIDGIQGDDRLPAMPTNAGYSDFTKELYAKEHNNATPPDYETDFDWVHWRAQKLTEYQKELYNKIKAIDPACIVSMAPSIFPWSKENYLQDWPVWVNQGYVDLIIPQLYRYNIEAYEKLMADIVDWQIDEGNLGKFYPGILLQVDDYNTDPDFLRQMIAINRKYGVNGEVYFFYEGIKEYPELFKEAYSEEVEFPKFK